jgi:hypothetical protein
VNLIQVQVVTKLTKSGDRVRSLPSFPNTVGGVVRDSTMDCEWSLARDLMASMLKRHRLLDLDQQIYYQRHLKVPSRWRGYFCRLQMVPKANGFVDADWRF